MWDDWLKNVKIWLQNRKKCEKKNFDWKSRCASYTTDTHAGDKLSKLTNQFSGHLPVQFRKNPDPKRL